MRDWSKGGCVAKARTQRRGSRQDWQGMGRHKAREQTTRVPPPNAGCGGEGGQAGHPAEGRRGSHSPSRWSHSRQGHSRARPRPKPPEGQAALGQLRSALRGKPHGFGGDEDEIQLASPSSSRCCFDAWEWARNPRVRRMRRRAQSSNRLRREYHSIELDTLERRQVARLVRRGGER